MNIEKALQRYPKEELTAATTAKNGVPGWTPFGAAIGAIGTIEGFKKVRAKLKESKKMNIKKTAHRAGEVAITERAA